MGKVQFAIVALFVALLIVAMTVLAAWAPKRYIEPSNGRPATVSMPHPPPIRGGG